MAEWTVEQRDSERWWMGWVGSTPDHDPGGLSLEGPEATPPDMRDDSGEFDSMQASTTDEVTMLGDVAILRGTWTVPETPKAEGQTVQCNEKWFTVQRRQEDGPWKTLRWMWNQVSTGEGR